MAGAAKNRQLKERKAKQDESKKSSDKSSPTSSQQSTTPPQRLSPPTRFDGNRDPQVRSRASSVASTGSSTRAAAAAASTPQAGSALTGADSKTNFNKNLDVGAFASFRALGYAAPTNLPVRPAALNKTGRDVTIKLNTWHVTGFPDKPVYQWDVLIGSGVEKRGLITRVWASKVLQAQIGQGWIFDGNRIAWSLTKPKNEYRILVNLDEEDKKKPRLDKKTGQPKVDQHRVVIKASKEVPFDVLRGYFGRKAQFDDSCLEAINFLDHALRESPTQRFIKVKRSFFPPGQTRVNLQQGVEAMKGVYASFRTVSTGLNQQPTLSVTVDVANGTFWIASSLINTMKEIGQFRDYYHMANTLARENDSTYYLFRPLKRIRIHTRHIEHNVEKAQKEYSYIIDGFSNKNAKEKTFTNKAGKVVSVEKYFYDEYKIMLQHPDLPLVRMTKKMGTDNVHIPAELCYVNANQRYSGKLSDKQTSEMIKFAVTLPDTRWASIEMGIKMLDWGSDKYLSNYGIKISPSPAVVKAKLLPNPKVQFANEKTDPRTSGRWDLKGKKFIDPHAAPLKSWGVSVLPGRFTVTKDQVDNFIREFIGIFSRHGGKVANPNPVIIKGATDPGKTVEELFNAAGNQSSMRPQLLVFIVPDKSSEVYNRLKKSADCRFGVVSQVLQSAHVQKAQAQYCSNVCMKVNAKLGGVTAYANGLKADKSWFTKPTMIIGADVSHGAPGTAAASIAAMTMSWDTKCVRFAAAVETNGSRVEIITKENVEGMLGPLIPKWVAAVGKNRWPEHILYFRDGVAEGQYAHILHQEVKDLRNMFVALNPKMTPKFTVVVATKRHHVRFFPQQGSGDKNNNPQPGTLVETGITHPFEYDFYLCSHSAIKGTARPVHYHVLLDEAKMGVEDLQNMIYESSYQYVRSTTPVSLFPAIYYAHLASNRGLSHIDVPSKSAEKKTATESSNQDPPEIKPLIKMCALSSIDTTMWYV